MRGGGGEATNREEQVAIPDYSLSSRSSAPGWNHPGENPFLLQIM